jgi:hypothetical protein
MFLCSSFILPLLKLLIRTFLQRSGLKGVDFGSFPILSKWIKDSKSLMFTIACLVVSPNTHNTLRSTGIFESLREYVTPRYISIDIPGWLNGAPTIISYY